MLSLSSMSLFYYLENTEAVGNYSKRIIYVVLNGERIVIAYDSVATACNGSAAMNLCKESELMVRYGTIRTFYCLICYLILLSLNS